MSAVRVELAPLALYSGNGAGAGIPLPNVSMAVVCVNVTALTATVDPFGLWLEVSDDGGTNWYPIPWDQNVRTITGGDADGTNQTDAALLSKVRIVDSTGGSGVAASTKFMALYRHLPADYVRARWLITATGSGAGQTFSVKLVGK